MYTFHKCSIAVALVAGAVCGADTGKEPVRKINVGMYLDLVNVSDPEISPDGKQIIFTRRWVDKMNDKFESALYVMNADGSRQRFLAKGSGARWSPDGSRIAFMADGEPKGNQIHVRWMDAEGAVTQITRLEELPSGISWSPDGKSIAFTKLVPQRETWNIKLPARPEGAKWTPDPTIVERLRYRADRQGMLPNGFRHIFVVSADGGAPTGCAGLAGNRCGEAARRMDSIACNRPGCPGHVVSCTRRSGRRCDRRGTGRCPLRALRRSRGREG